jgi:hypothetical protein
MGLRRIISQNIGETQERLSLSEKVLHEVEQGHLMQNQMRNWI